MSKLKSSFVLKKYKEQEKLVELYLNFGYKEFNSIKGKYYYKPLRYYTGVKVHLNEWDSTKKLPINQSKLNELLSIQKTAHDIYNYLVKDGSVTPESFRNELDSKLKNKENTIEVIRIGEYIREVMIKQNSSNRSSGTLRQYKKLANRIETFEEKRKIVLTINNFNEELYLDFLDFYKQSLNRINSVWGVAKNLKAVLNEISRKYKIDVFNPTRDLAKSDKVQATTEDKLYMKFEHIQQLINFTPKTEKHKNVKLILLTLLFSGCRYSDVFKIKPEFEYKRDDLSFNYARFISTKVDQEIIIPILKPLEEAYEENNGNLPYKISDVNFNKYVKELLKDAGLNDDVKLSFTDSNNKKQFETKKFYQFVSSHIGRRSFITNLINFIPVTILTKITGHSLTNKNVIFGYNKISLLDNTVLFMKELKRVAESNPKDFPIKLV